MNNSKEISGIGMALVVTGVIIYRYAYKDGKPTCHHYLFNTYMYILFALFGTIFAHFLTEGEIQDSVSKLLYNRMGLIIYFIVSSIPYYFLMYGSPEVANLMFLLLIINYGIITNLSVIGIEKNVIIEALFQVIAIVIILTAITFKYPNYIKDKWEVYLSIIICFAIILYMIFPSLFTNPIFSLMMIIVFSFAILVDTKQILNGEKDCKVPNYPQAAISVFLDGLNLFLEFINLKRN